MNTRKQRIRLTESDLRNIVKESAKQIISELDWKTYASAADKSLARDKDKYPKDGRYGHEWDFEDAAQRAFKQKHGLDMVSDSNDENEYVRRVKAPNPHKGVVRWGDWDVNDDAIEWDFAPKFPDNDDIEFNDDIRYDGYIDNDNYTRASDEVNAFQSGDYGYQKGKWHKKQNESLNRIVRESINRVLRRR